MADAPQQKVMLDVLQESYEEIDRHMNVIADIIQSAGNAEPIDQITLVFPQFRNFFIKWSRNDEDDEKTEQIEEGHGEEPQFESLPGPYRIDPLSGNAFRIDSEQPPYVWITDPFGGHETQILRTEFEEWEPCI